MRERFAPPVLRAAWWTWRALVVARRGLRAGAVEGVRVPRPPRVAPYAIRGVFAVLRRSQHTCLERSLVLQRWYLEHGRPRDVVVGVTAPRNGFTAHAWLEGDPEDVSEYRELLRLPAR
jgi:hypothetical protein